MVSVGKGDFNTENAIVLNHGQNNRAFVFAIKIKICKNSASINTNELHSI